MRVERLSAGGFRNLESVEIEALDGVNIIYGDNAQGKTNLIEGIWLFTGAKSFRGAKDSELRGLELSADRPSVIKMDFFAEEREQNAEIRITDKKEAFLNGIKKRGTAELAGAFHAVVFSPLHVKLVEEGPEARRKFLDGAIGQLYPKYIDLLHRYARAVTQRNMALKSLKYESAVADLIDVFEHSIAGIGGRIVRYRLRYINILRKYAPEIYDGISGGKEVLNLEYVSKIEGFSENEAQNGNLILSGLRAARAQDAQLYKTSCGPHRDDMDISVNDLLVRSFGSQGQKRSTVLTLKLAEAEVLKEVSGEQPVALLDDVMSELDAGRQDYILNHINGWQVFITCCDPAPIKNMSQGRVFHMDGGRIK